jgi:alkylation response protein AidB-like acyl-CoA dehydrogenase
VSGNVISLYVRTDPQAHYRNGMSFILMPNDTHGVICRKLDLLGHYCARTYEVTFDNVCVPRDHLIGQVNKGWDCLLSGVTEERAVVAAADVGASDRGHRDDDRICTRAQTVRPTHRQQPGHRSHAGRYESRGFGGAR